jgi:hypothetical protein
MIRVAFPRWARAMATGVVTATLLTSCSWFLGPDEELDAEVSFDVSPDAGQDLADSAGVTAVERGLEIVGAITTPDACRELNGEGDITTDRIIITMRADADPAPCPGVLGRFDYTVTVFGVKRGSWLVQVRHVRSGQGEPVLIATRAVVVP